MMMIDNEKYARIYCFHCKEQKYLTKGQYNYQMDNPDNTWHCPDCGDYGCDFDDDYWEESQGIND